MKAIRRMAVALLAIALFSLADCKPARVGAYVPSSALTVPAWYIDPQNTSGCASDSNTGQSATCTGGPNGPLKTWFGLNTLYWNCTGQIGCPRLRQTTTVTFVSNHTDNTDPVAFWPSLENGAAAIVTGTPSTVCAGTLGTVTAKVRTNGSATLLSSTALGGGCANTTLAVGQLVQNTTHSSYAWVYSLATNAPTFTQPLAPSVLPNVTPGAEVNTWATSDVVTVLQPTNVELVRAQATVADFSVSANNVLYLTHLNVFDPGVSGALQVGGSTRLVEASASRAIAYNTGSDYVGLPYFPNDFFSFGIVSTCQTGGPGLYAGAVLAGNGQAATGNFSSLDDDVILKGTNLIFGGYGNSFATAAGLVYVDTSSTLYVAGYARIVAGLGGGAIVWGPGTLDAPSGGRIRYAPGAGVAAADFQITTIQVTSAATACLSFATNAATTQVCNISLTAANLDTNLGATNTGCLYGAVGGGAFCNSGF